MAKKGIYLGIFLIGALVAFRIGMYDSLIKKIEKANKPYDTENNQILKQAEIDSIRTHQDSLNYQTIGDIIKDMPLPVEPSYKKPGTGRDYSKIKQEVKKAQKMAKQF